MGDYLTLHLKTQIDEKEIVLYDSSHWLYVISYTQYLRS
jgi:hypothetical protein